jgi:hypothetical protein
LDRDIEGHPHHGYSLEMVNIFKQLNREALIQNPLIAEIIHSMAALFVDYTDLHTRREEVVDQGELCCHT